MNYVLDIKLEAIPDINSYPFNIPAVKFLNEMENMICNTDNVMEAGLLAICMCGKE